MLASVGVSLATATSADAHFVLNDPPAVYEQGPLGDPQKDPPCGADGTEVTTSAVTSFQAGDTITISIDETVYHPGHYRVALALNDPSELPPDPQVTPEPGGDPCAETVIMDPPVFPVLADGVLDHDAPFPGPQTIQVTIPDDVNCDNCTLQVIQYMRMHGAPCFYHHCATIQVQGGAAETGMGSGDDGPMTSSDDNTTMPPTTGDAGDTTAGPADDGADDGVDDGVDDGGSDNADAGTAPPTTSVTDTDTAGTNDDSGGCSCSSSGRATAPLGLLLGVLTLVGLRRRH